MTIAAREDNTQRIMQIAHNHPSFHSGGTELTALALHREAIKSGLDSWYLGALDSDQIRPNLGTQMISLSEDHREAALFTDGFKRFPLSQEDNFGFLREFRDYLRDIRPDVVHLHHILNFGLEAIHCIRSTLPEAKIVLTVHDYYLICAYNGQLYKHETKERCPGPSLIECLRCFPQRRANDFTMRKLDIQNAMSLCDRLISPSFFLKEKLERYIALTQRVDVIENGYLGADIAPAPRRDADDGTVIFGYFGNISAVKGLADLLDAADILAGRGIDNFSLHVHGMQLFEDKVLFDRMAAARSTLGDQIRFFGSYTPDDMGIHFRNVDCLVFPSVWWENAPLVVYEALYHGRQVVTYPHGGAPEIVSRYGLGLIAEQSNPLALANAMMKVCNDKSLSKVTPDRAIPGRKELLQHYCDCYAAA